MSEIISPFDPFAGAFNDPNELGKIRILIIADSFSEEDPFKEACTNIIRSVSDIYPLSFGRKDNFIGFWIAFSPMQRSSLFLGNKTPGANDGGTSIFNSFYNEVSDKKNKEQGFLKRPSFERLKSGVRGTGFKDTQGAEGLQMEYVRRKKTGHYQITIDPDLEYEHGEKTDQGQEEFSLSRWGSAATDFALVTEPVTFEPSTKFEFEQHTYVLITLEDLSLYEPEKEYMSQTEADQRIRDLISYGEIETGELQAVPLYEVE